MRKGNIVCRITHKKYWKIYAWLSDGSTYWRKCNKCGKKFVTEDNKVKYYLDGKYNYIKKYSRL